MKVLELFFPLWKIFMRLRRQMRGKILKTRHSKSAFLKKKPCAFKNRFKKTQYLIWFQSKCSTWNILTPKIPIKKKAKIRKKIRKKEEKNKDFSSKTPIFVIIYNFLKIFFMNIFFLKCPNIKIIFYIC